MIADYSFLSCGHPNLVVTFYVAYHMFNYIEEEMKFKVPSCFRAVGQVGVATQNCFVLSISDQSVLYILMPWCTKTKIQIRTGWSSDLQLHLDENRTSIIESFFQTMVELVFPVIKLKL